MLAQKNRHRFFPCFAKESHGQTAHNAHDEHEHYHSLVAHAMHMLNDEALELANHGDHASHAFHLHGIERRLRLTHILIKAPMLTALREYSPHGRLVSVNAEVFCEAALKINKSEANKLRQFFIDSGLISFRFIHQNMCHPVKEKHAFALFEKVPGGWELTAVAAINGEEGSLLLPNGFRFDFSASLPEEGAHFMAASS